MDKLWGGVPCHHFQLHACGFEHHPRTIRARKGRFWADSRTIGELAEVLGENRFLVMQHLNLLRESNLVTVEVDGRRRINHLNPVPIQQIFERWVGKYQGDWAAALVGLKRTVETKNESRTKGRTSRE